MADSDIARDAINTARRWAFNNVQFSVGKPMFETLDGAINDAHEVAVDGSDAYLYLYGPDADALLEAVRPTLLAAPFMKRATATKVYGELGSEVRREEVQLAP